MDDLDGNYTVQDPETDEQLDQELSHSDKAVGIFTEPAKTFDSIAKFPPRTIDWFLPILILFLLVGISNIVLMNNPEIASDVKAKQMEKIQENFDQAVAKGQMSREQADEQLSKVEDQMDMSSPVFQIIGFVSTLIIGFIIFFIIAGVHFLFSKFALKGEGNYASALVANGLASYIGSIQVIIGAALGYLSGRLFGDTSAATFMNVDKTTFSGVLLSFIDPISIFAYIVLAIGLAKMFKAATTGKFYVMVFGLWIFWSLFIFAAGQYVPFFKMFVR